MTLMACLRRSRILLRVGTRDGGTRDGGGCEARGRHAV
jgi:hypothetical protein